jgi:hypothetical protein
MSENETKLGEHHLERELDGEIAMDDKDYEDLKGLDFSDAKEVSEIPHLKKIQDIEYGIFYDDEQDDDITLH